MNSKDIGKKDWEIRQEFLKSNPMPESKKLSELIDDYIDIKKQFEFLMRNPEGIPIISIGKIKERLEDSKNQIDQKFEELRCRCEKHIEKERRESLGLFEKFIEMEKEKYSRDCTVQPWILREGQACSHKHTYNN